MNELTGASVEQKSDYENEQFEAVTPSSQISEVPFIQVSGEFSKPIILNIRKNQKQNNSASQEPSKIWTLIDGRSFSNLKVKSLVRSPIVIPERLGMYAEKLSSRVQTLLNDQTQIHLQLVRKSSEPSPHLYQSSPQKQKFQKRQSVLLQKQAIGPSFDQSLDIQMKQRPEFTKFPALRQAYKQVYSEMLQYKNKSTKKLSHNHSQLKPTRNQTPLTLLTVAQNNISINKKLSVDFQSQTIEKLVLGTATQTEEIAPKVVKKQLPQVVEPKKQMVTMLTQTDLRSFKDNSIQTIIVEVPKKIDRGYQINIKPRVQHAECQAELITKAPQQQPQIKAPIGPAIVEERIKNPIQTQSAAVQYESLFNDLNTIVMIANACMYNFRLEMPIYTDSAGVEVVKVDDFHNCMTKLGLKKYVEAKKFNEIIKLLNDNNILISSELINVSSLFELLRQMNYDFCGRLLAPSYHLMSVKAHRIMNRYSRLMALYATQQTKSDVTVKQVIYHIFPQQVIKIGEFMTKLKELNVRKSANIIEMPVFQDLQSKMIDRAQLCSVTEVYLKNNYLKSFGYRKLKLTAEILAQKVQVNQNSREQNEPKYNRQFQLEADDEEFYFDNK